MHPVNQGDYTGYYPKSLVKAAVPSAVGTTATASQKWSYTADTLGHDVDMEALSCGPDACATYLYVGDEYNYVYRLTIGEADAAAAVQWEWDLNTIVGAVSQDKGIESITYAASTGYFYVGIQDTSTVHVVTLAASGEEASPTPAGTPEDEVDSATAAAEAVAGGGLAALALAALA